MQKVEFKRRRERLNMTQGELAERMRVNVRSVKRWESGEVEIPYTVILALRHIESEENDRLSR